MSRIRNPGRWACAAVVGLIITAGVACGEEGSDGKDDHTAPPASMCAFITGDGEDGRDNSVKHVVWPSQKKDRHDSHEEDQFVPCNARNFIVNPEGTTLPNGDPVGDSHVALKGATNTRTPVNAWARGLWELNESEDALRAFYELCDKYTCASEEPISGSANFSTDGWNGMLAENFRFAMDEAFAIAVSEFGDDIAKEPTPAEKQKVADRMSAVFADTVRATTGYSVDLFCGSNDSGWDDPEKPGEGEFRCTQVRFRVDDIFAENEETRESNEQESQAEAQKDANAARLEAARAAYGPMAEYWLGLHDLADKCKQADTQPCVIAVGNPPNVPVG